MIKENYETKEKQTKPNITQPVRDRNRNTSSKKEEEKHVKTEDWKASKNMEKESKYEAKKEETNGTQHKKFMMEKIIRERRGKEGNMWKLMIGNRVKN